MKCFSVIGAGNLGVLFIDALLNKGYTLKYIYKKSKYAHLNSQFVSALENDIRIIINESDFVIIASQESKIRVIAEMVASSTDPKGKVFFHTSNSLTSDELESLKKEGASVASFSPLQTFPQYSPGTLAREFEGIYFLAEGDVGALKLVEQLSTDLGAQLLVVDKADKIYFHIASVAAANFFISILKFAECQLRKVSGEFDIKILLPLIKQTLENVKSRGVDASLSGPVKRKEWGVIQQHLQHLKGDEATLYNVLTEFLKREG